MEIKKLVSIFFIIILFFPLFVFADGGAIRQLPEGTWDWVDQNSQEAFISYQNGIEKLIIGVDFKKEFSQAVWIIPVPTEPKDVKIDIVSSLPQFYGWEVARKAIFALGEPAFLLPYPIVLPLVLVSLGTAGGRAGAGVEGGDVVVVAHLEKAGMIAEVLTAKTDQALYDYLSGKGFKIERGAISVFNQYIGKEYSFVVSWVSSEKSEELIGGERGIYITFPTRKIYYPLLPTSAYGEKTIPITIRILGYVKPKVYSEIRPYLKTEYYTKAERYSRGAAAARCYAGFHQLSMIFDIYKNDYNMCPVSLEELKIVERDLNPLLEDMKRYCPSLPSYSLEDCTLSMFLGNGKELFLSSTGIKERDVPPPQELKDFYSDKEVWKGNSNYTKITINAPSEKFTEDLWLKSGAPLSVLFLSGISELATKYPWQTGIFLVALLSFLIGGISGKICFGKFKKYALIGLSNIFTILGLILVMVFVKKEENPKSSKPAFVGLFFVIYFIASVFLAAVF